MKLPPRRREYRFGRTPLVNVIVDLFLWFVVVVLALGVILFVAM